MYKIEKIKPMVENTIEELYRYIADVSGVVRDKEIKNPEKLFNRLTTEAVGGKASSVLAFVPVVLHRSKNQEFVDKFFSRVYDNKFVQYFGFIDNKEDKYCTNMREMLNIGCTIDEILPHIDFTNYQAYKAMVPYFIYQQIRTHTQVNFLSHSQRYTDVDYGYYKPNEVDMTQEQWNTRVENTTPKELKTFLKNGCNVIRKEIYARGADMLKYRPFTMGFNTLNPNSWKHFKDERSTPHTQLETRNFVSQLSDIVKKN